MGNSQSRIDDRPRGAADGAGRSYRVVEAFCEGKYRDGRNEDRLFTGPHHVAVVDGSSAAAPIGGRAGGLVAAEVVVGILDRLAPEATIDDFEGAVQTALALIARDHAAASPCAAAVVVSLPRREVWRIGDCPFAIDSVWNIPAHNPHEQAFFRFRQMMAAGYARAPIDDRLARRLDDSIAGVTRDWLGMTKNWVNVEADPFGFAALDERSTPARFREVFPLARGASQIVLASDGAVVSCGGQRGPASIAEMLDEIEQVRRRDPCCVELFPYWRGFLDGATYLDDVTLLTIAL